MVLADDDLEAAPTHGMGLWGAELGLERGQAGLNWRLGFRAAGESHCTPKPSEVPHYPLKLMVVSGDTEAPRRRDSADLAKPVQKGRSRSRNWRVRDPSEAGAWMKELVYSPFSGSCSSLPHSQQGLVPRCFLTPGQELQ